MAEEILTRFWVGWRSGYYEDEGCTAPPFQVWITGSRDRDDEREELSFVAVVDAPNEEEIWQTIEKHFPDYTARFCNEQSSDFRPSDRFLDFENRTSLKG